MKIEIFDEPYEDEETLRLKLEYNSSNEVRLIAVNSKGIKLEYGNLLRFEEDGRLILHQMINKDLGLKLDKQRHLKVEKD